MRPFKFIFTGILVCICLHSLKAQYSCATAVSISNGYTSGSITTPGTNGAEDWVTSATTCGATGSYYTSADVYMFAYTTGGSAGEAINFSINAVNDWMAVGIFSSCSGGTLSGCVAEGTRTSTTGAIIACASGLAASTTYYIAVSRWGTPDALSFSVTGFTADNSGTVPNDECAGASSINLDQNFNGSTSCNYTASAGSPSACGMSIENDSWMKFTAASANVSVQYNVVNCLNNNGVQLSVFSGACGGLSLITGSCVNPALGSGTWNFSGLTSGSSYYIRIDGYAGDKCNYTFNPVAGVAVVPPNDLIANAKTLSCNGRDTASIIFATSTDAPAGCTGGGTPGKGVWYKLTGNGGTVTLTTDDAYTNFDTQLNVYSGAPGTLTCVTADDDAGSGTTSTVTFSTTNGTNYYIYADGNGAAEGTFIIKNSCSFLPIILSYFNGKNNKTENVLSWESLTELNADCYLLERSSNGEAFQMLGKIPARGNSHEPQLYQFKDTDPFTKTYYRLKMVDRDGTFEYSEQIVLSKKVITKDILKIVPNPAHDRTLIQLKTDAGTMVSVSVNDLLGRQLVKTNQTVKNEDYSIPLNLETIETGSYFLMLVLDSGEIITEWLVKY